MRRPAPVAELLAAAFEGKPAAKRLREGRIWLVWEKAVGAQIAGQARPAAFRDGVLTVYVASAPWMQQLTYLKKELITQLNGALGEELVHDIFLKAGRPEPLPASPEQALPKVERPLTTEEAEKIATETASIEDPELRAAVASLLARHLRNNSFPTA